MDWVAIDGALEAGDHAGALEAVVAAWRAHRHPLLADLIDAIAGHVEQTPIDARSYHASWLELARDGHARDVGALLAGLRRALPRPHRSQRYDAVPAPGWTERIAALARRPDDPRLAAPIVRVLRDVPWSVMRDGQAATYGAPLELIARTGDARAIAPLEELLAAARERRVRDMWYVFVERVPPVIEALREHAPAELAEADRAHATALIAQFAQAVRAPRAELSELLAAVRADPDDEAARAVYGDVLLEQGDPLGELIALQLGAERGELAKQGLARARSLVRANHEAWLGDLAHVLKGVVYERGLIAEADLEQNARAVPAVWERATTAPQLATVHTLNKGRGNEAHYQSFVFAPAMRGLRRIEMLSSKMIDRLCRAPEPWPFTHLAFARPLTAKLIAQLAATEALPHLERITVAFDSARIAETARLLAPFAQERGLVEVSAHTQLWYSPDNRLAEWFATGPQFGPVALGIDAYYHHIVARPGERGLVVDVELSGAWAARDLLALRPIERLVLHRRARPGTRISLGGEGDLDTDPRLPEMLAELAPLHPELAPEWDAARRAAGLY